MKKYRSNKNMKKRCDCARRTWETCKHPWFFAFQWKGHVERGSLGVASREDAIKKFADIKAAMMNGTYSKATMPEPAQVIDRPTFAVKTYSKGEAEAEEDLDADGGRREGRAEPTEPSLRSLKLGRRQRATPTPRRSTAVAACPTS